MWIEASKTKYRACTTYKDPLTGKRHKIGVTMDKNTPQARNKAKAALDELIAQKQSNAPDGIRLGELMDLYIRDQRATLKASTVTRNENTCRTFLKIFGNCEVNNLTAGIVKQRFLVYTDNPTTINEYITRYKALMRWAYQNDFVRDISYLGKLTRLKDKTKREKVADKFLESSECKILLEAMHNELWRDLTEFMLLSGLRIGEALALDEEDLDFTHREIHVTKTVDHVNGIITDTKTMTSTRDVYMQDALCTLSRSLVASNRRKRTLLYLEHTPLFFGADGRRASYAAYIKYIKKVSEQVLGRKITSHTLRHTHASLLAEQEIPLEQITRRLGHADSRITKEIYIHITERRKKKENERLKNIALF